MAADAQTVRKEPEDLEVSANIAKVLGVSQRTLIRWSSTEVSDPIPRYLRTVHKIERACLSWADVRAYCERNRKHKELARLKQHLGIARTPDMALSEQLSAPLAVSMTPTVAMPPTRADKVAMPTAVPVAPSMSLPGGGAVSAAVPATPSENVAVPLAQSVAPPTPVLDAQLEELRAELRELRAGRDELAQRVSGLAAALAESRQGEAVLRETVNQLQKRLASSKERLAAESARGKERLEAEVERRLEERTRLDAQLADLQINHDKEVQRLVEQLGVHQGEIAEMRQATERQQQRSTVLSWQAAANARDRDVLLGIVKELEGASMWKRLTWRVPALGMDDASPTTFALPTDAGASSDE